MWQNMQHTKMKSHPSLHSFNAKPLHIQVECAAVCFSGDVLDIENHYVFCLVQMG